MPLEDLESMGPDAITSHSLSCRASIVSLLVRLWFSAAVTWRPQKPETWCIKTTRRISRWIGWISWISWSCPDSSLASMGKHLWWYIMKRSLGEHVPYSLWSNVSNSRLLSSSWGNQKLSYALPLRLPNITRLYSLYTSNDCKLPSFAILPLFLVLGLPWSLHLIKLW